MANIQAMSVKMVNLRELELQYRTMERKILENGISINYMARPSVHDHLAKVIGGSTRITTRKDMEQARQLME
jgi:hypothetical protein